ncbi:MAG: hypothetical protein OEX97_08450, partial [Acidimicrobiia bacterium]|nr:hypothetical protein [Acidimicrobiia bacterium]
ASVGGTVESIAAIAVARGVGVFGTIDATAGPTAVKRTTAGRILYQIEVAARCRPGGGPFAKNVIRLRFAC